MKTEYDSESDALYIQLSKTKPDHVVDIPGVKRVSVDVDTDGRPVGIEMLFASGYVQGDLKALDPDLKPAKSRP